MKVLGLLLSVVLITLQVHASALNVEGKILSEPGLKKAAGFYALAFMTHP